MTVFHAESSTKDSSTNTVPLDAVALEEVERRVLWLSTRIIDHANRERENLDGLKVGGHQASSASSVSLMTALWFHHLDPSDRVAIKPHASPVYHAINYLMGLLDRGYLTRLRDFGGLQSYPSRTKDPVRVDFSTGSVGFGATAPLFAAVTRRYVDHHFGPRPRNRFFALIGDAELDEGNIWEALVDPAAEGLGNVRWLVDFNRQSLDRVVPGVRIGQWRAQFKAAGWNVVEVKYGGRLRTALALPGSAPFRSWFDDISNEQYQSLFALTNEPSAFRARFLEGSGEEVGAFCARFTDEELVSIVTDLGGHDIPTLVEAFESCDEVNDRPSVVFCYTVKGWGLPIAGNPRNHSALLTGEQIADLRTSLEVDPTDDWAMLPLESPAGQLAARVGARYAAAARTGPPPALPAVPEDVGAAQGTRPVSSQEVFGRTVTALARVESVAPYLVSTAPDVATTTNLAGFINRVGSFSPSERRKWTDDRSVEWKEDPTGQHIELGISEMNFFTLLEQLGLSWDLSDQPLLAIGTVYDPFVLRGLDALIHAVYSGSRFVFAGTPSGITLAPEGGAHQSTITPSVGLELPNIVILEPAYARATEWLLCDALSRIAQDPSGAFRGTEYEPAGAYYFRLSTRSIDQSHFEAARERLGDRILREQVIAGAYRLIDATETLGSRPMINIASCGAVLPEAVEASQLLSEEGVAAHVIDVTSQSRINAAWRGSIHRAVRASTVRDRPGALHAPFAAGCPILTVHDASSHSMAWLGSALGVPAVSLGVDTFGQSGTVRDVYRHHLLDAESIATAALTTLAGCP